MRINSGQHAVEPFAVHVDSLSPVRPCMNTILEFRVRSRRHIAVWVFPYSIAAWIWWGFTTRRPKVEVGAGGVVLSGSSLLLLDSTSLYLDRNPRMMALMVVNAIAGLA